MSWNKTRYEVERGVAWITLDSPENRNALSAELVSELGARLRAANDDAAVRVIVLTGSGSAFCAGADLKNRGDMGDSDGRNPFVGILESLRAGEKPVIAAVNGAAFGGGLGLVAAADVAIAVAGAKFSFSEVRLGLIPAMISVVVLPKLGEHQTLRLFLTGERFDANAALDYGLLHKVAAEGELRAVVNATAAEIAKGGPIALAEAKRLVRTVSRLPSDEAFRYAEEKIAALFASDEAAEGMAAFVQKRSPRWVPTDAGE